jgi:hypothetical protein
VFSGNHYQSVQEFLRKMDLGLFDGKLHEELEKLSREQLIELAELLRQRSSRPPAKHIHGSAGKLGQR